ncbi:Actinidain [Tritrichomonas foetus]|uniref:Actinidain n=1 Tax=Tritrichomonas foetus TaxID=1144522 RepID=A0A1J4KZZ3_9EUKA|nr:Actinidain [Tritrichomonas foetus]|eukprot:OHT16440.1 Actinidain [Tritrichomonas foetus]
MAFFASLVSSLFIQNHEEKAFLSWMRQYNEFYTQDEYHLRLGIFLTNMRFVQNFKGSFKVGLNRFAAITPSEYMALLGNPTKFDNPHEKSDTTKLQLKSDPPSELDWRAKGAVTDVQDQGGCGSCWAFAGIATIEGAWAVANGELYKLSEQNPLDCSWDASGCYGGAPRQVFIHAIEKQEGKFMLAADYPYLGYQDTCHYDPSKALCHVSQYQLVFDEGLLQGLVATYGPTAISMDASGASFQMYTSGIYDGHDCTRMHNHAVTVVGYGEENGVDYWIVKNSWGSWWGEEGYFRILRMAYICEISTNIVAVTGL